MQTSFGVTSSSWSEVGRAVVSVEVNEWVTQREGLSHTYERVVNGTVTVWVITSHGVTGNASTFHERTVGTETLLFHVPDDATVNWL